MLTDIENLAHGYLHPESTEYLLKQGLQLDPGYRQTYKEDLMERCPIRYWMDLINLTETEMYELLYMGEFESAQVIINMKWIIKNYANKDKYYEMLSVILKTEEMVFILYYFEHLNKRKRRKAIITFLRSGRLGDMTYDYSYLDKLIDGLGDPKIARIKKWEMIKIKSRNRKLNYGYYE